MEQAWQFTTELEDLLCPPTMASTTASISRVLPLLLLLLLTVPSSSSYVTFDLHGNVHPVGYVGNGKPPHVILPEFSVSVGKGSYHLNKMLMQMIITNELLSFIVFNMNDHCPRNYAIFHNFYGNSAIFWTVVEQLHWFKSMIFYRIFSCYTLLLTWSSANCWWSLGLWFLIPACIHVKTN